MNARTATLSAPSPNDAPACGEAAARRERQLAMLDRLAEIGMAIVEEIGREVMQAGAQARPAAPGVHSDPILAFTRASRAVRMTIALQARLMEEPGRGEPGAGATLEDMLEQLDREDEAAARAAHHEAEPAERLARESAERLERETRGDLAGRPFDEILDHIRRDLGLASEAAGEAIERDHVPEGSASAFQDEGGPQAADLPPPTRHPLARDGP